jgi:hypothetical protein
MEFICTPEQLTAESLTKALQGSGLLDGAQVTEVNYKVIGTGKMGDNLRLRLQYSKPCAAPATMIAKLPAADETARSMASMMGAYSKEVRFYTELAKHNTMRTPEIYHAMLSDAGTEFILLMEDLAPAEPGDQLCGESLEHTTMALSEAAKLHASFHGKKALLASDFITKSDPDAAAFGQELLVQNWPGFVERFGKSISAECLVFGEHYIHRHTQWVASYRGVTTMIHGDFRAENMLFGNNTLAIVDWQTLSESFGLCDVAYFMGGSLEPELRREHEKELVEHYRSALSDQGVTLSAEDCWQQYRLGSMHGIMITVLGAMFSAAEERSDRMFLAMIQRHLQHCVDLNAAALIP